MLIDRRSTAVILRYGAGSPCTLSVGDGKTGPDDMVWIQESDFLMGADNSIAMPNERPAHTVQVSGFWMDRHDVTHAQFEPFVEPTTYVTTAEQRLRWADLKVQLPPGTSEPLPEAMVPREMVFVKNNQQVSSISTRSGCAMCRARAGTIDKGPAVTRRARGKYSVPRCPTRCQSFRTMCGKRLQTEAECPPRGGPDEPQVAYRLSPSDDSWTMDCAEVRPKNGT